MPFSFSHIWCSLTAVLALPWVLSPLVFADQHLHTRPVCQVRAVPRAWLASWAGGYCRCTGHCARYHVCYCHLKIICDFWARSLHFHFALSPINYLASPASEPRNSLSVLKEDGDSKIQGKIGLDKPGTVRRRWAGCSWDVAGKIPGTT